jgi:hypothetical protein
MKSVCHSQIYVISFSILKDLQITVLPLSFLRVLLFFLRFIYHDGLELLFKVIQNIRLLNSDDNNYRLRVCGSEILIPQQCFRFFPSIAISSSITSEAFPIDGSSTPSEVTSDWLANASHTAPPIFYLRSPNHLRYLPDHLPSIASLHLQTSPRTD